MFCFFFFFFLITFFYLLKNNILILLKKLMMGMAATALFMYDNVLITFCILKPLLKNNNLLNHFRTFESIKNQKDD